MVSSPYSKPVLIWCLANLFFAYQFILRLSAGILREQIMQKFAIDCASFGTLAGYYYLGYASSQIPLGIMLDRMSFRIVTSMSILATAIGTFLFVSTENWNLILFARFLIGAGSGIAFLSVAKITKSFFDEKYQSMLLGLSFTFGLTGAVFGSTPMMMIFNYYGYDNTFKLLGLVAIILSAVILLYGKIEQKQIEGSVSDVIKSIIKLITNPNILIIGISGGLMVGALEGFADLWGISFFKQVYQMTDLESSAVTSFVYFGMCFGGPVLALMAGVIRSANLMIFITGLLTVIIFVILFNVNSLTSTPAAVIMFCLGILCCYQVLVFTVTASIVESSSTGLAIAVINCMNMSFGHFFHSIIGNNFARNWDGKVDELGNAIYSPENFIYSLSVIPICCFIGQFGFIFLAWKNRKKNT